MPLNPGFLRECLSYDPETGEMRWRERPREHFASEAAHKTHSRTKAGRLAGCIDLSTGYLVVGLSRRLLYAHRVAWAILHDEWPRFQIDHIDGDKLNNAERNLRCVTQAENSRNASMKRSNVSGVHGVSFARREGKWRARIMHEYHDIHLGYFDTLKEAVGARRRAEKQFGFHPNHGRPTTEYGARHGIAFEDEQEKAA